MKTLIETQTDGYKAEISESGIVTIIIKGRKTSLHCSYLKQFDELHNRVKKFISEKTKETSGLWASISTGVCRLRDIGDACQIVIDLNNTAKNKAEQAEKEFENAKAAYAATCPEGYEPCSQNWTNGDLCSAEYQAADGTKILDTDMLEGKFGVYFISKEKINQKRYVAEKAEIEKAEIEKAKTDKLASLVSLAIEKGQKQVVRKYTSTECHDNLPDCSFDNVTVWVDGQGKITESYTHCY